MNYDIKSITSLYELLPYNIKNKVFDEKSSFFNNYDFLLECLKRAINALIESDFENFDSLIGNSRCQQTAFFNWYLLAIIKTTSIKEYEKILEEIESIKCKIPTNIDPLLYSNNNNEITIYELILKLDIDLKLNQVINYFLQQYVCSISKGLKKPDPDRPLVSIQFTDYKKLKEIKNIPNLFSEEIVKFFRKNVSYFCVDLLLKLKSSCNGNNEVVPVHYERGLKILPFYIGMRDIFNCCMVLKTPIVLISRQIASDKNYKIIECCPMFYQVSPITNRYEQIDEYDEFFSITNSYLNPSSTSSSIDTENPLVYYIIVNSSRKFDQFPKNISEWKDEFKKNDLVDMILSFSTQYANCDDSTSKNLTPSEYSRHNQLSKLLGCTPKESSLFFFSHALTSRLSYYKAYISDERI